MLKEDIISQVVSELLKKAQLNKIYSDIFDVIDDAWGINHGILFIDEDGYGLDKKGEMSTFDFSVTDWNFDDSVYNKKIVAYPQDVEITLRLHFDELYVEEHITEQDITKEELYNQFNAQLPKLTNMIKTKAKQIEVDGTVDDDVSFPMTEDDDKVLPGGLYDIKNIKSVNVTKDYIEIKLDMEGINDRHNHHMPAYEQDIGDWNVNYPD